MKQKIALFCNLGEKDVISMPDVDHLYRLPLMMSREQVDDRVCEKLGIWAASANMDRWHDLVNRLDHPVHDVRIAIVGKYVHLADTYKSLNEALKHGGIANGAAVELRFVDSETVDVDDPARAIGECDAVLVPGGFGERGTEGKIAAIRYAREHRIPFFGICLGMQLAVVECARDRVGLVGAMSREFDPDPKHPVVDLMESQKEVRGKGGTMRLGAYPAVLSKGSLAHRIYGRTEISERHRHRFEVNTAYVEQLAAQGLVVSGWSPDGRLPEVVEMPDHPWFLGCQYHPEFKSRPLAPHPLFVSFIRAAVEQRRNRAPIAEAG
jgi:CTP synthase